MIEVTRPLARHAVQARPDTCPERCNAACVRDPALATLRARIRVQADDSLAADAAGVSVHLNDGRRLGYHLDLCQGSEARPNWTMRECRPPVA